MQHNSVPNTPTYLLHANFLELVEEAGADANLHLGAVRVGVGDVVEDAIKVGERHLNAVNLGKDGRGFQMGLHRVRSEVKKKGEGQGLQGRAQESRSTGQDDSVQLRAHS